MITPPMLTLITAATEAVRQSLTTFVENQPSGKTVELSRESVSLATEALASSFQQAGRAAIKAFVEQFESGDAVVERDGRTYRRKGKPIAKQFLSIFGPVTLERSYYYDRSGGGGLLPLDERWGMSGRYATPEVTERLLWAAGTLVASQVSEAMQRLAGIPVSTSCVQDIISSDGAAIAEMIEDEGQGVALRGIEVPDETEVFVASMDGANVLMREPGVRCGRKPQRPSLHDADADEEEPPRNTAYRNAMVGSHSFYKVVDGEIEKGLKGLVPRRLESVYNARMPQEKAVDFKKEFEAMIGEILEKAGATAGGSDLVKILLTDAARPLRKYITGNPLFADFRLLVDYFHSCEHLSHAAEAIFGKESRGARNWFAKWCRRLKYEEGAPDAILRSMKHYRETKRLSTERREQLDKQITFFKGNKDFMNYPEHVANGWAIGSGPVEAACKSLVKARLCQSGMRWSTKGGRNILALRVLAKSKQWDTVWAQFSSDQQKAAA